jgi:hypothetical protein
MPADVTTKATSRRRRADRHPPDSQQIALPAASPDDRLVVARLLAQMAVAVAKQGSADEADWLVDEIGALVTRVMADQRRVLVDWAKAGYPEDERVVTARELEVARGVLGRLIGATRMAITRIAEQQVAGEEVTANPPTEPSKTDDAWYQEARLRLRMEES